MLQIALGLQPEAFDRRLRIEHPYLSDWLEWVMVRNLRVGEAEVDLRYERSGHATLVAVGPKEGEITVMTER